MHFVNCFKLLSHYFCQKLSYILGNAKNKNQGLSW